MTPTLADVQAAIAAMDAADNAEPDAMFSPYRAARHATADLAIAYCRTGGWLPIESAPRDGALHVRGLHVHRPDGTYLEWQAYAGSMNDEGEFLNSSGESDGWEADDYSHWQPLPAQPVAGGA